MAKLNIVKEGDPILRKTSKKVEVVNDRIIRLLDDMRETLIAAEGAGLAAVQVGVLRRVVIVAPQEGELIELINPEIVEASGEQTGLEGCLSIPGKWGIATRPNDVMVKALNRSGEEFTVSGTELTARAFCHELDHLDGKLFIDVAEKILSDEELEEYLEEQSPKTPRRRKYSKK